MKGQKGRNIDFDDLATRRTTTNTRFDSLAPLRKDKNEDPSDNNGPGPTQRGFLQKRNSTQSLDEEEGRDVVLPDQIGRDHKKNAPVTTPRG